MSKRKRIISGEHKAPRNAAVAVATGVATAGAGYLAHRHGIDTGILNAHITPQPPTRTEVVDGMVAVNEGIRSAAPVPAFS